jgi:hypothetical protein
MLEIYFLIYILFSSILMFNEPVSLVSRSINF